MTAAPPTDADIIAALRSLHERFLVVGSTEPLVTVDSFLHYDEPNADVTELLRRDPVIASYLALDQPMLNVGSDGTGYDVRAAITTFLRRIQGDERTFAEEAKQLIRALRLTDGVVPVRVRTVLLGFSLREPVPLPFVNCPGHSQRSRAPRRLAAGTASERLSSRRGRAGCCRWTWA